MVDPSATTNVITVVYRHLAKRYHPDRAGSAGLARMAELNHAYAVLSDPVARGRYDRAMGIGAGDPAGDADGRWMTPSRTRDAFPGARSVRFEAGGWSVREPSDDPKPSSPYGEAGEPPPLPRPSGSVLSYGRYRGWSIAQVAARDPDYLEWLSRTMAGKRYRDEVTAILRGSS